MSYGLHLTVKSKTYKGENMIKEIEQDLFVMSKEYYLAHCISGDYALGAGIAKQFNNVYDMRSKLRKIYPIPEGNIFANVGKALLVDNVFNLVTKQRYFQKPTYNELRNTLIDMREQCKRLGISKLAVPLLGCGLDRLQWDRVKEILNDVFSDVDIEILVCKLKK